MNGSTRIHRSTPSPAGFILAAMVWLGASVALAQKNPRDDAASGPGERLWSTQWNFDDVEVEQLLGRLRLIGLDIGVPAQGKVSAAFKVGVPWTNLRDATAYRFDGTLTSKRLVIDSARLSDLKANVVYRDGVLKLTRFAAGLNDTNSLDPSAGRIEGAGSVELAPRGDLSARLELKDVVTQPIIDLLAQIFPDESRAIDGGGAATGSLRLRVPLESVRRVETYQLDGSLLWRGVQLAGFPPADVEVGHLSVENKRLRLDDFTLDSVAELAAGPIRIRGKADLPVTAEGPFSFALAGDDLPLAEAAALAGLAGMNQLPDVEGKLDLRLEGNGALAETRQDSTWRVEGAVASPALRVAGVELGVLEHRLRFTPDRLDLLPTRDAEQLPASFRLRELRSRYKISERAFKVTEFSAKLFGGQASGSALLSRASPRDLSVKVKLSGLRPVARATLVGGYPVEFSATLRGEVDWRTPIDGVLRPSAQRGSANLAADDIRVGDAGVGDLTVRVVAAEDSLSLESSGKLFGGTVEARTIANTRQGDRWSDVGRRLQATELKVDGVSIGPLIDAAAGRRVGLTGEVVGELSTAAPRDSDSSAAAATTDLSMDLVGLAYGPNRLSRRLSLLGNFSQGELRVRSLAGDYAGGAVNASGRIVLPEHSRFDDTRLDLRVSARRVKAGRALWFTGGFADRIGGRVTADATVSGRLRSLRVSGGVSGDKLAFDRLAIGSGHSSLAANLDLGALHWDVHLPSIRFRLDGGTLKGDVSLASARRGAFDLRSEWNTQRMDVVQLSGKVGAPGSIASGALSGKLVLGGKAIRSVKDLVGRFDFNLGRTRGAAIPGLIGVSRLLGPVSLGNQLFETGAAHGVIGRGTVVVEEFWLGSDKALVRADGKVYLASGRLDLEAIIATGDYRNIAENFAQMVQENAFRVLLPASAVLSVSELLRDRTVVIAVGGTVDAPIVRLLPVETFREEVARFLFREGQRLILAGFGVGTAEAISSGR